MSTIMVKDASAWMVMPESMVFVKPLESQPQTTPNQLPLNAPPTQSSQKENVFVTQAILK